MHARVGGPPHRADVLRHLDQLAGHDSANPTPTPIIPGSTHDQ
jgi:hypothetical protein